MVLIDSLYLNALEETRSATLDAMHEMLRKGEEDGHFPKLPLISFPDDKTE